MSQTQQKLKKEVDDDDLNSQIEKQETDQLVPVTEAIKYRKRAQSAEQQLGQISKELTMHEEHNGKIEKQLKETQLECELIKEFANSGVRDIEVTLLLAKKELQVSEDDSIDIKKTVEAIRQKRPALFDDHIGQSNQQTGLTAGLRIKPESGRVLLNKLAQRASQSGSMKDMQEYLKVRRSFNHR